MNFAINDIVRIKETNKGAFGKIIGTCTLEAWGQKDTVKSWNKVYGFRMLSEGDTLFILQLDSKDPVNGSNIVACHPEDIEY